MSPIRTASSVFLSCFLSLSLAAQQSVVPRQSPLLLHHALAAKTGGAAVDVASTGTTAPSLVTYTLYAGLWRIDHTFVSTIRIKNSLVVAPLDVQPILFMEDGTDYALPPVQLPVSGVLTLNINEALARASESMAGHMSSFGSAALIYRYPNPGHVMASIAMVDVPRSLSFACPFGELMNHSPSEQALEGLWWKHDAGVSGFLALSNLTDTETSVNVRIAGSRAAAEPARVVEVAARSVKMMNLDDLMNDLPSGERQAGGISLQYEGEMGGIAVTGGLENDGEGYSANIPFFFKDLSSSPTTQVSFASVGVMVGKPDPTMMPGFPAETIFTPYLVLRNSSERRIEPEIQLNYMLGDKPVSRSLGNQVLRPFEAKQVDLQSVLNAAGLNGFNGPINLSVSLAEHLGDLVLATGSVDQTGNYVLGVEPQGIGESGRKIGQYWSVAQGNNTMFGLWNPTDQPQDILVTIFYGNGSGKYILPTHLDAHGSTMIGMAMLIAEKKPDANGNLIPAGITEGSASFENSEQGKNMTLVIAGGTLNVADATCHPVCITCCGITPAFLPFDPFCPIGAILDCSAQGTNCDGTISTLRVTSWSSSNTSVATITSLGVMTAIAPGQSTITGALAPISLFTGQICLLYPTCNQPAAVSLTVTIVNLNCPSSVTRGSSGTCNVSGAPTGTTFSNWKFTDSNNTVVTSSNTSNSWSGVLVTSGRVNVTVGSGTGSIILQASVAVTNRNWHTNPASPAEVPNGTFAALPVPPQPSGNNSGLGISLERTGNNGFASTFISDGGPNNGYGYYATQVTFTPLLYQYEINPDLENTSSIFYQSQCGNYNASSNTGGFISGSNLLAQTRRHEYNSTTQSHYAFYSNSISAKNNPGDYVESRIATPGTTAATFDNATNDGLNNSTAGIYAKILADFSVEPFSVNESETGVFLGNINYAPYAACN